MGASLPLPLLPPRILSVPGVKSEGCRAKNRKEKKYEKKNRKGVRESSESLSLLLSPQSSASFSFHFPLIEVPCKSGTLRCNEVSTEIIPNQISRANHLMAREVL